MKHNVEIEIFFELSFYVGDSPSTHATIKTTDFDEMIQFGKNTISKYGLKFLRYETHHNNDIPSETFQVFDWNGEGLSSSIWITVNDLKIGWESDDLMLEMLDRPHFRKLHDKIMKELGIPKYNWAMLDAKYNTEGEKS